jgi:hypothetical protein
MFHRNSPIEEFVPKALPAPASLSQVLTGIEGSGLIYGSFGCFFISWIIH